MIKRIILIVLDGAGVGALPDAAGYGDEGANTIGHVLDAADGLTLINLEKLGLYKVLGRKNSISDPEITGCYGKMATKSPAKDTTAGHWEMAGIVLEKPFPTYPDGFPKDVIEKFENLIGTKVLGNCTASGTEIIKKLGDQHCSSGFPIVYTSADSVFQIAAHEQFYGLEKLYNICETARDMLKGEHAVGRVIARPFTGEGGNYARTVNRKDYSLDPVESTVLDNIKNSGGEVIAIGKIEDIFNGKGITKAVHTKDNVNGTEVTAKEVEAVSGSDKKSLIFTNLVDFDMLWGHRRNVNSYAKALKDFDNFLPRLIEAMKDDDMLMITADHGCDPSFTKHTDHTREYVPLLVYGNKLKKNIDLGIRESLSDIARTIADIFELPPMKNGKSFKRQIIENRE
ncbi:MAG: phosphopentomutase [Endomicrobia bacterium]|nr:phosphopentomutase [Endomicrobiia bacterium]MCL2145500.1 phosphopentomutase [Endomicrobiia bacterium]